MLDKKVKDINARKELLEDRSKYSKYMFLAFFSIGWVIVLAGALIAPYKYDENVMCVGIALLIISTWFYVSVLYYNILICLKGNKNGIKNRK